MKTLAMLVALAAPQDRTWDEVNSKLTNLRVSLDFKDSPIDAVIDYLREIADMNIFLDGKVRDMNLNVSLKVSEVSLRSVLKLLLQPHGCDLLYREGVVMVMTKEDVQDRTVKMEIYDCRDILYPIQDFPGVDLNLNAEGLGVVIQEAGFNDGGEMPIEEMVRAHTGGTSWDDNPRCGVTLSNGLLIVKNTPTTHKQVARLLDMLRANK